MRPFLSRLQNPVRGFVATLGPGILYAAAAVGLSHLVQATRAGAHYGMGLMWIVILACILKYPSLRFGGDYAAATGRHLIDSYRQEGRWAIAAFAFAQLFAMLFIVAAVSLFTLGLIQASLGFSIHATAGVGLLLAAVVAMLMTGGYRLLEQVSKYIVAAFTVLTVVAFVLVATRMEWSVSAFAVPVMDRATLIFIVALIGFMPTPIDASVLQSLWTCARTEQTKAEFSVPNAQLDFNTGYIISAVLALCFMVLGAGVIHASGVEIAGGNSGFARQFLMLFTEAVGGWSFPLIALCAVFVMLSTLFTVVDGMARILVALGQASGWKLPAATDQKQLYRLCLVLLCGGAVLVLALLLQSFATFIDLTATLVFIISPLIAILNHRAMWSGRVSVDLQPGEGMKIWSLAGILAMLALSLVYLWIRFVS